MNRDPEYRRGSGHGPPIRWGDVADLRTNPDAQRARSHQLVSAWGPCARMWAFQWNVSLLVPEGPPNSADANIFLEISQGVGSVNSSWEWFIPLDIGALGTLPTCVGIFPQRQGVFPIAAQYVEIGARIESNEDGPVHARVAVWVAPYTPVGGEC